MIRIFEDAEAMSRATAELFAKKSQEAIGSRNRFGVALAGGNTPRRAYELLATPEYASRVDWSRVHVFWGDERFVPPDDPRSNEHMAREALLDHVPIPEEQIHPMYREGDPSGAADAYCEDLDEFCHGQHPTLDLVMLGMGPDGHTASLFPGGQLDTETQCTAIAVVSNMEVKERITLTIPVLARSRTLLFLVAGADKAVTLRRVLVDRDPSLPAAIVAGKALHPVWFLDRPAAASLPPEVVGG